MTGARYRSITGTVTADQWTSHITSQKDNARPDVARVVVTYFIGQDLQTPLGLGSKLLPQPSCVVSEAPLSRLCRF